MPEEQGLEPNVTIEPNAGGTHAAQDRPVKVSVRQIVRGALGWRVATERLAGGKGP